MKHIVIYKGTEKSFRNMKSLHRWIKRAWLKDDQGLDFDEYIDQPSIQILSLPADQKMLDLYRLQINAEKALERIEKALGTVPQPQVDETVQKAMNDFIDDFIDKQ